MTEQTMRKFSVSGVKSQCKKKELHRFMFLHVSFFCKQTKEISLLFNILTTKTH